MLQKFIGAVVLVLVGSVALADTIRGMITKADEKTSEITITPFKKGGEKGEAMKLKVGKKTTYFKIVGKGKTEEIEKDGLKVLMTAIEKSKDSKGVFGTVEEEKGKASKISFFTGKLKKKPKDKDLD